jgi:hypothetical protein
MFTGWKILKKRSQKNPLPQLREATGEVPDQPPTLIEPAMMPVRMASISAFSAAGTALSKL